MSCKNISNLFFQQWCVYLLCNGVTGFVCVFLCQLYMLRLFKKIWASFCLRWNLLRGLHTVRRAARLLGQEVEMFFCWLEFAVANEKFRSAPVAKTAMCVASCATVAAVAVVECWRETRGAVGQRLTEIVHWKGFLQTALPVWGHPVRAGGEEQQGVDLQAQMPPPDPLRFHTRLLPQVHALLAVACFIVTFLAGIHMGPHNNGRAQSLLIHPHSTCHIIWDGVGRASMARGVQNRGQLEGEPCSWGRRRRQVREVWPFGGNQGRIGAFWRQQRWRGERGCGRGVGWRCRVWGIVIIGGCQDEPQTSRVSTKRVANSAIVFYSTADWVCLLGRGQVPADDGGLVVRVAALVVVQLKQGQGGQVECWGAFL